MHGTQITTPDDTESHADKPTPDAIFEKINMKRALSLSILSAGGLLGVHFLSYVAIKKSAAGGFDKNNQSRCQFAES